jgi:hypothetical protein
MEKIRIWDKNPGSATLAKNLQKRAAARNKEVCRLQVYNRTNRTVYHAKT